MDLNKHQFKFKQEVYEEGVALLNSELSELLETFSLYEEGVNAVLEFSFFEPSLYGKRIIYSSDLPEESLIVKGLLSDEGIPYEDCLFINKREYVALTKDL